MRLHNYKHALKSRFMHACMVWRVFISGDRVKYSCSRECESKLKIVSHNQTVCVDRSDIYSWFMHLVTSSVSCCIIPENNFGFACSLVTWLHLKNFF